MGKSGKCEIGIRLSNPFGLRLLGTPFAFDFCYVTSSARRIFIWVAIPDQLEIQIPYVEDADQ